jgi:hypothetical protein
MRFEKSPGLLAWFVSTEIFRYLGFLLLAVVFVVGCHQFFGSFSLNCTIDEFAPRFNEAAEKYNSDVILGKIDYINTKDNKLRIRVDNKIAVKGIVNTDKTLRAVGIIVWQEGINPVKTNSLPVKSLIAAINPDYPEYHIIRIIGDMGSGRDSGETVNNGLKYRYSYSEVKNALCVYIYRPDDLVYHESLMALWPGY